MRPKDFCVNQTVVLDINGSQQTLRLCARTAGLPPLLIVQGGPGLPLLPEAGKFQQRLRLEEKFLVVYWDQRGCGRAQARDAQNVSLSQQLDDLRFVLHWLKKNTGQKVTLMGVSLGATLVLQAAEQEQGNVTAVVAVSPDTHTAISDAAAAESISSSRTSPPHIPTRTAAGVTRSSAKPCGRGRSRIITRHCGPSSVGLLKRVARIKSNHSLRRTSTPFSSQQSNRTTHTEMRPSFSSCWTPASGPRNYASCGSRM